RVGDRNRRRTPNAHSASSRALGPSSALRQYAAARRRSRALRLAAASTRVASAPENSEGWASRAETRTCTAHGDSSPSARASAVAGISSSALASRTRRLATGQEVRNRWPSHADVDRYPSRRYGCRRSISARRRARSASNTRAATSISQKSASSSSSERYRRSSERSSSSADRTELMPPPYRTGVRLRYDPGHRTAEISERRERP